MWAPRLAFDWFEHTWWKAFLGGNTLLTRKLRGSHHTSLLHSGLCREAEILTEVSGFWA